MATISGTFRAATSGHAPGYASARKQGTGWNPVHAIREGGTGRETAPSTLEGSPSVPGDWETYEGSEAYGYQAEDHTSVLWGYGTETGTADRPSIDPSNELARGSVGNYPDWGPRVAGVPGGGTVRSLDHGAETSYTTKLNPDRSQYADGANKLYAGTPDDADEADASQVMVQTSDVQRDKTRAGSERGAGSASTFDAPIKSRIPGGKIPRFSGGYRHEEMTPQTNIGGRNTVRPYFIRQGGTGPVPWMQTNSLYESTPLNRVPPDDPSYNVPDVGTAHTRLIPESHYFGYVDEDVVW